MSGLLLVLLAGLAHAGPEDALDGGARAFFLRAEEEEAAGHHAQAAQLYRLVLGDDPSFQPASLGLGRALEGQGDRAGAEALYRSLGDDADAVEALARLLEPTNPAGALACWQKLQTLRMGDAEAWGEAARLYAATDVDEAWGAFVRYRALLQGDEPSGATVLAVGAALLAAGRTDDARAAWQDYVDAWPEGRAAADVRSRLDRLEVERAAESLALGGSEPLPARLLSRYAAAQAAVAAGDLGAAEEAARALVAAAPRSAEAHALLADVLVADERWEEAEIHAVFARVLAPDDAANRVRLGLLLQGAYGGRRDREAADELQEAAMLRPADVAVQAALGRVEQRLGAWDRAEDAFERALEAGASGDLAVELEARLDDLRRVPPPPPAVPDSPAADLPPDAESHYRVALVLAQKGRTTEAITELEQALAAAPESPLLLNKRARLARQAGAAGEAETWLGRSLEVDPAQPDVLLELGDLARARGDAADAEARLRSAAELGAADAHYQLARLAEARGDWAEVRKELAAYEAGAPGRASLYASGAADLRARADQRMLAFRLAFFGGLALVVGVPGAAWAWRRSAKSLRGLLDGAPESWHDAATLLAALRHEVLKHNTTVLPDIADALARGDVGPWRAFAERAPDLLAHFRSYLGQLEALGRRHGLRVALARDPILGPMERALARLVRLGRSERPPAPDELRRLSHAINGEGYRAIAKIVREICVLPITSESVRAVYARVSGEPGFAGGPLPDLEVRAEGDPSGTLAVRMFRADLEDILANVLRNALSAGAGHVAVELGAADDPVTGHPWVEIAVVDDAPGTLTNAMIRGRAIGRGLGLAVDLINRHGGSIRVEPRGSGRKAVVVQLGAVEAAAVEVEEWTAS